MLDATQARGHGRGTGVVMHRARARHASPVVASIASLLLIGAGLVPVRAGSPTPTPTATPTPRPPGGNQPVTPSTVLGSPIILPRAGSVALHVLSTNTAATLEEIGLDQPTHTLLIPNAINNVGA
jgi:hypothetical protein